jgi:medium-chain acyl-[acyl-carrier-protein] hydrolase
MQSIIYNPKWYEKFQVHSYDIGFNGLMRVNAICGYFQEIAEKHAEHLGVGYDAFQKSDLVWVLSRLFIEINRLPAWKEILNLETWPLKTDRIFHRRDYQIVKRNEILISAASYWIPLDINTRRPRAIQLDETVLKANEGRFGTQMFEENISSVPGNVSEIIKVRYSDLDQNRHVNNARYVEWTFDHLGLEILEKKTPRYFTIEYKQEVKAGDQVLLRNAKLENTNNTSYIVEGIVESSKRICFRSKIVF